MGGVAHLVQLVAVEGKPFEPLAAGARADMDGVRPEYLALVDPDSFQPVATVDGRVLIAVAARIGATRLIDNIILPEEEEAPCSER